MSDKHLAKEDFYIAKCFFVCYSNITYFSMFYIIILFIAKKRCKKQNDTKQQEVQRYGRNKDTVINHSYIDSGEYRKKFDRISTDKKLNRKLYQLAKKMLKHPSGTSYEDMYWIDINTLQIIASETEQKEESRIKYSVSTRKIISKYDKLLTIHTHPNSMPPSINDFNSAIKNKYRICIVCCHDGKIFMYQSKRYVIDFFYKSTIFKYKTKGYGDFEAQILALTEFQKHGDIDFKEV